MLVIDTKEIKRLEADLKTFARRAMPYATRNTLNKSAFEGQKIARTEVKAQFINRNRFTVQSIQVDPARSLNINRQAALLGSTAGYMEKQEFGGTKKKSGSEGVPIATSYSAGGGLNQKPRLRFPRKPNQLQNIRLRRKAKKGRTRRQQNFVAIREAATSGQKFVFLDLGRKKGIFRVLGGKRKPYIRMVADLSETTVEIPKSPWLWPTVEKVKPLMPAIHAASLQFQIDRYRLFKK